MSLFYDFNATAFNNHKTAVAAQERAAMRMPLETLYQHTNYPAHQNNHTDSYTAPAYPHVNYYANGRSARRVDAGEVVPTLRQITARSIQARHYNNSYDGYDGHRYDYSFNDYNPPHEQHDRSSPPHDRYGDYHYNHYNNPHTNYTGYTPPQYAQSGHNNNYQVNYYTIQHANYAPTEPKLLSSNNLRVKGAFTLGFYSWDANTEKATGNPGDMQAQSNTVYYYVQIRKTADRLGAPISSNWRPLLQWGTGEQLNLNSMNLVFDGNTSLENSEGTYQLAVHSKNIINGVDKYSTTAYVNLVVDDNNTLTVEQDNRVEYLNFVFGPTSVKTTSGTRKAYDSGSSFLVKIRMLDQDGGVSSGNIGTWVPASNGPTYPITWANGAQSIAAGQGWNVGYAYIPFATLQQLEQAQVNAGNQSHKVGLRATVQSNNAGNDSQTTITSSLNLPATNYDPGFVQVDIVPPSVTLTVEREGNWEASKNFRVQISDALAGLDSVNITCSNGQVWNYPNIGGAKSFDNTLRINSQCTATITTVDFVGNRTITTKFIERVDEVRPQIPSVSSIASTATGYRMTLQSGSDASPSAGTFLRIYNEDDTFVNIGSNTNILDIPYGESRGVCTVDNAGNTSAKIIVSAPSFETVVMRGSTALVFDATVSAVGENQVERIEGPSPRAGVTVGTLSSKWYGQGTTQPQCGNITPATYKTAQYKVPVGYGSVFSVDLLRNQAESSTTTIYRIGDYSVQIEENAAASFVNVLNSSQAKIAQIPISRLNGALSMQIVHDSGSKIVSVIMQGNRTTVTLPTTPVGQDYMDLSAPMQIWSARLWRVKQANPQGVISVMGSKGVTGVTVDGRTISAREDWIPITHTGNYLVQMVANSTSRINVNNFNLSAAVPTTPKTTQEITT